MGLRAELDIIGQWGFPLEVSGGNPLVGDVFIAVDYVGACKTFVETFIAVATELVPVDTGYLRSTINAGTNGYSFCFAEATADYAEYVEYGTWQMDAQPYFEPALRAACDAAHLEAVEAVNVAKEMVQSILESLMEAAMSAAGAGPSGLEGSFGDFLGGLGMFSLMAILLFPLLVNLYGIVDSIFGPLTGVGYGSAAHDNISPLPEIIIT